MVLRPKVKYVSPLETVVCKRKIRYTENSYFSENSQNLMQVALMHASGDWRLSCSGIEEEKISSYRKRKPGVF